VLFTVLRIKRTLDGAEIDKFILDVQGVGDRASAPGRMAQGRAGREPFSCGM
jgi:hypothetical protein